MVRDHVICAWFLVTFSALTFEGVEGGTAMSCVDRWCGGGSEEGEEDGKERGRRGGGRREGKEG